jgi:hypothetical protein
MCPTSNYGSEATDLPLYINLSWFCRVFVFWLRERQVTRFRGFPINITALKMTIISNPMVLSLGLQSFKREIEVVSR